MIIVDVNHRLPILHLYQRMVDIYTIGKTMNQFEIVYMIDPSFKFNNAFITQGEKCLGYYFSIRVMKTIKMFPMHKNTSVMALIIIYENNG